MWNRIFVLFFLFVWVFPGYSEEKSKEDSMPLVLAWQEVPGASNYILEIRDSSNSLVVTEKLTTNSYNIKNLTGGKYEHRIGLVNKLGKTESFTDWVPFEIVVSRVPGLSRDRVYYASKTESKKTIAFEGKNFIDPFKVYLAIGNEKFPASKVQLESSEKAIVEFDLSNDMKTGIYDIVFLNPRNKKLTAKQRFVLSDTPERAVRFATRQEKIIRKEIPEDYYETPYWSTFWRSIVLPGWGQRYIDGQNWKLWVYPLITAGVVGAYANSYNNFLDARKNYENATTLGALISEDPSLQLVWFINNSNAEQAFSKAKNELNVVEGGVGLFGVFVIYNLVDSYFAARRNVAQIESPSGLPLLQENIRIQTRVDSETYNFQKQANYSLQFQLSF